MKTNTPTPQKRFGLPPIVLILLLVALVAIEYFFAPHYHPVFPWHHVPGYMAVIGLVASVVLVALAKGAGTLFLQRAEDADDRD